MFVFRETLNKFVSVIASTAKQSSSSATPTASGSPRRFAPRDDRVNQGFLSALLWILAAILEGAAAWFAFGAGVVAYGWLLVAILHIAYAVVLAFGAWLLLPLRYRQPRGWALLYLFCVGLCIPVLGWFGMLLAILPGLIWQRRTKSEDWTSTPDPDLPYKAIEIDPDAIYRRGGLATVVRHDEERWRLRAVMATRYLQDRHAVPVLRSALADPVDEIRLMAYALLNSKTNRIERAVAALRAEAATNPDGDTRTHAGIDEQIAALYLEQAELGLVDGAVRTFVLEQALERIDAASKTRLTAPRAFIRGRICLRLQRLPEAEAAFDAAENLGFPGNLVAPYLAESAFERGNYLQVRTQLARLSPQVRRVPLLASLVEYWV